MHNIYINYVCVCVCVLHYSKIYINLTKFKRFDMVLRRFI